MFKFSVILLLVLFTVVIVDARKKKRQSAVKQLLARVDDLEAAFIKERDELYAKFKEEKDEVVKDLEETNRNMKYYVEAGQNLANGLQTQVDDLKKRLTTTSTWPAGNYCILSSGGCPAGFILNEGYLRAIKLYDETPTYIKPVVFGDSKMDHHVKGHKDADLYIASCCKEEPVIQY